MQTQTNDSSTPTMKTVSTGAAAKVKSENTSAVFQTCIQNCLESSQLCIQTIDHCLTKGGQHAESKHIKLLQDCAELCQLSAHFMLRNSDFHSSICQTCADVCTACADNCETMAVSDAEMKACAEACKKSALSCQDMATMQ